MTPEGITLGIVLPVTCIEHITPVKGDRDGLVEEILTDTKIQRSIGLAISLCNDPAGTVVTRQLDGNVIRKDKGSKHTGIPRETAFLLAGNRLSVDNIGESVEFIVIAIDGRSEVKNTEKFILANQLYSDTLPFGEIHRRHIHHTVCLILITDALHDIRGRTIIGRDTESMFLPRLQEIKGDGMGILRSQFRITE